jgi:ATP-dependent protease Clp ATPase subunit
MLDVMYELPQTENVEKVVINRAVVQGRAKPKLHFSKAEEIDEPESKLGQSKDSPADAA